MKKLNNNYDLPSSGFTYTQPETMEKFQSKSFPALLTKIKAHRVTNNIPIGTNFVDEVENEVCSTLPEMYWRYVDQNPYEADKYKPMGLNDIVTGTKNLVSWMLSGMPRVDYDTANGRAAICAKCQDNKKVSGCFSCGLRELVVKVTEEKTTAYNGDLGACMNCQCSTKALVWLPQSFFDEKISDKQAKNYPSYCWKIKDRNK